LKALHHTELPQLSPASSGTIEAVTPVTPGIVASSSSVRMNNVRARAGSYPLNSGDTPNVMRLSTFKPRSTRLTFIRLRTNRPAEMSSAIESAICAVTSTVLNRAAVRAPDGCPLAL
jgi:hypothetical protein